MIINFSRFDNLFIKIATRCFLVAFFFFPTISFAQQYSDDEIADAIWKAEGCDKYCDYLFGIRSVNYKTGGSYADDYKEARRITLNTIRNNRKRYAKYGHETHATFLEFLSSRYAPIGAKNDPRGLNKNWLKNVQFFLERRG